MEKEISGDISLMSVGELFGKHFFIPGYQRGYRWKEQQVTDLLNDIKTFGEKSKDSEIYCLQPLVIQKTETGGEEDTLERIKAAQNISEVKEILDNSDKWTVVDGQQRLTTIYLILDQLGVKEGIYQISYQRYSQNSAEDNIKEILKSLDDSDNDDKIDHYHMRMVRETIKKWFDEELSDENKKEEFKKILLDKVDFIRYVIRLNEEPIAVFTRLNIGKIPLTDSELIKALILNRSNFLSDTEQQQIALEWDQIERTLQNDEFWLFIHEKDYTPPTRIDFILDLKRQLDNQKSGARDDGADDGHRTFRYYYEKIRDDANKKSEKDRAGDIQKLWEDIKNYYQILLEWYNDYRLYHYIGYLVEVNKKSDIILNLISKWEQAKSTEDFLKEVKHMISDGLWVKEGLKCLDDLKDYIFDTENSLSKSECKRFLLLHNIETVVRRNDRLVADKKYSLPNFTKFPFHLFKSESWNVEHIRSNAGDDFGSKDARRIYLNLIKDYYSDNKDLCLDNEKYRDDKKFLHTEIDKYLDGHDDALDFNDLLEGISKPDDEEFSDEDKNKIWNFALLDEHTNKEYGNAIFPIKRIFIANKEEGRKIVKFDIQKNFFEYKDEIAFVPPCTENVFSKFYNAKKQSNMTNWTKDDAEAYFNDIKDKLEDYKTENY